MINNKENNKKKITNQKNKIEKKRENNNLHFNALSNNLFVVKNMRINSVSSFSSTSHSYPPQNT